MSTVAEHLAYIDAANKAGDRQLYEYHAVLLVDGHFAELARLAGADKAIIAEKSEDCGNGTNPETP